MNLCIHQDTDTKKSWLFYILFRIACNNNDHPIADTPGASLLQDTIACSSRDTESFDTQGNKHA